MKKLLTTIAFATTMLVAGAQGTSVKNTLPPLDKSPMDMAYFPADFPILKVQSRSAEPLLARVIYSRPTRNGRTIFGDLVPYNEVWRLGANEATEVEFYREVRIGGKKVPKGKYTIYAITTPQQWTVIFNKETDTWGAFKYDEKKDVVRVTVPVETLETPTDAFTILFDKADNGARLVFAWENVRVAVPVQPAPAGK